MNRVVATLRSTKIPEEGERNINSSPYIEQENCCRKTSKSSPYGYLNAYTATVGPGKFVNRPNSSFCSSFLPQNMSKCTGGKEAVMWGVQRSSGFRDLSSLVATATRTSRPLRLLFFGSPDCGPIVTPGSGRPGYVGGCTCPAISC